MELGFDIMTYIIMILAIVALGAGIYMIISRYIKNDKTNNLKRFINKNEFMTAEGFMSYFSKSVLGKGKTGFKYADCPGCYVVKVFSAPTKDMNNGNLYDIIVESSEAMCETVYDELTGYGDSRLYDYYNKSKSIYIKFILGDADKLDELEAKTREEFKDDFAKVEKKHSTKSNKKSKKKH